YMRNAAISDPTRSHKYYANKTRYYNDKMKLFQIGEKIWKNFKDGPQNDGLVAKNTPAGIRGAEDASASGRSSGGTSSSGAHPKGIASVERARGSSVRSGDVVTVSSGSGTSRSGERGMDDSMGAGELPPLNGPGKAADENTIVGKRSADVWGPNNEDPSKGGSAGSGDNSFFASGDGARGGSLEGGSGGDSSNQGGDSTNLSFAKGDSSDRLDPDFFKKTQGAKTIAEKSFRKGARNSGDIAQPSESVVQRSLASKPELSKPDKNTSADPSKNSYVVNPPKNPSGRGTGRGNSQLGYENNI
ncbi:MAG: hypothetical protein ACKOA8_19695, partial [Deltaproteobacteria bacterium]